MYKLYITKDNNLYWQLWCLEMMYMLQQGHLVETKLANPPHSAKIAFKTFWFLRLQCFQIFVSMFDIGVDKDEPNMNVLSIDQNLSPDEVVIKILKNIWKIELS